MYFKTNEYMGNFGMTVSEDEKSTVLTRHRGFTLACFD